MAQFPPIIKGIPGFLHGGDYNPEQWIKDKDTIWKKDMELAQKAGINTLSIGIASWSMLEPKEHEYHFEWLDEVMDMLAENGIKAMLGTPVSGRPPWMAKKYPEVMRVTEDRKQMIFGFRNNQCPSSPVYREKAVEINTLLAERYKNHPALGLWHIDNEFIGECHCPRCQATFQKWLQNKYGTIDALNDAWWNTIWSHRFDSFDEIESPSSIGECRNPEQAVAWRRFVSWQFCDFYQLEAEPMKRITPDIPCMTNMLGTGMHINYFEMGKLLDCAAWDNYPEWTGDKRDDEVGTATAFKHDLMRCTVGKKPFLMTESSPSCVNWQAVNRLHKPGVLELQSIQAIAHGSDSVQYFQFRSTRGGSEPFHGAIVTHDQREDNRIFQEVCGVGHRLKEISQISGSSPENKIALIYDWENRWALDWAQFGLKDKKYERTVIDHYAAWVHNGFGVDIIDETKELDKYRIVCGPMTYMLRPGFADRVRKFVHDGGVYITTYCSGWVDQEVLCFLGGFPGEIKDIAGVWNEETDTFDQNQHNHFTWEGHTYQVNDTAAIVHPEGAETLAVYEDNFYVGTPALTKNTYGKGECWYIAARTGQDFLKALYRKIAENAELAPLVDNLPEGVICTERKGTYGDFLFMMNFMPESTVVSVPEKSVNILTGKACEANVSIPAYGYLIIKENGNTVQ